jgi:uncharacterized membrane protein
MMLGLQVKAFSLLLVVLLIVDAAAFHGQYRTIVGGKISSILSAISPSHWGGSGGGGGGRDWANPGRAPTAK